MKSLILLSLLLLPMVGLAAEEPVKTRSAGKYLSDQTVKLEQKLATSPVVESSIIAREREVHGTSETVAELQSRTLVQHPLPVSFDIFDAWVVLSNDLDGDGYFHHLNVIFDAVTEKTRAIAVNSPSNPTGWIMPRQDMIRLRDFARERGLWLKKTFFEQALRIPFIVHAPHRFKPLRVPTFASLLDLVPTLASLGSDGKWCTGDCFEL